MKKVITLLLILIALAGYGQEKKKRVLIDSKEQIILEAKKELNIACQPPEGEIYLFVNEHEITGEYDFDISIHEKGLVASVFVNRSKGGTIKMQNMLKDFIKDYRFYFKMPKGKKFKFNYIFKFN